MATDTDPSLIPLSESDTLLRSWGYDLLDEYTHIARTAASGHQRVVELATGTGRLCAVLAGLFDTVITGDITLSDHGRAVQRIPAPSLQRIQFSVLNMERLPFRNDSVDCLLCLNTLHEVRRPFECLRELMRVVRPDGTLIAGDFNRRGFDTMQRIHEIVYHNDHPEGVIPTETIGTTLSAAFETVTTIDTTLNITYVATGKRTSPHRQHPTH